ncbi:alpha/beta hydrolase [Siculibacillus lacustris]|uniref:Alpha/beta hydrolase n=1 Tax=Siculibacillus lacustris TaxID=1549641 RepID=A0A4Q9VNE2_9HYPH|nr:alpha/beta hydrolase [Siculibacillus lacustris]TBW36643.1 alpha/beta hydrolase [Siculibacillus lacustris]
MRRAAVCFALLLLPLLATPAPAAGVAVSGTTVGGVGAALLVPPHPKAALVLMTGGDGQLGVGADGSIARGGNQLVRTREAYAARGFAVLVPEGDVDVGAAVAAMSRFGKVTVVATSRGTQRAARGIAAGARPARLVLTSGFLSDASGDGDNAMRILGSPATLPPTLIVHHRHDGCRKTSPEGVAPFLAWAAGRARVTWLDGGSDDGDACQVRAHHGFAGLDGEVVAAVAGFAAK